MARFSISAPSSLERRGAKVHGLARANRTRLKTTAITCLVCALLITAFARPAVAQEDIQILWWGYLGAGFAISVNPTDGSCWVGLSKGDVVHLAEDGHELSRTPGFRFTQLSLEEGPGYSNP